MAYRVGRTHFIPFRVGTVASPVNGLALVNFVVVFTMDNVDVDPTTQTFTVVDNSSGRYCATYVPTNPGFYYTELYHAGTTTLITDGIEIDTPATASDIDDVVNLTQDFGGVGALKPTVDDPEDYILMVFYSRDWQVGNTDNSYAIAMTSLDSDGNWLSTPLPVNHDTYHIVIKNNDGNVVVIRAFLVT